MTVLDLVEDSYVAKVWFISWEGVDLLAGLYKRHASDTRWAFNYRFRYHRPDPFQDPFTDDDKKSEYHVGIDGSEEELTQMIDFWAETIARGAPSGPGELFHVPVRGGCDALKTALSTQPWAHSREMN